MTPIALLLCLFWQFDPPPQILKSITPEKLRGHIAVLAHDSLEGRGPSTAGDVKATDYIVSQYKRIGLIPAGEGGSYQQPVPLVGSTVEPSTIFLFSNSSGSVMLKYSTDFVASPASHETEINLQNVPVVFVGYGIVAPEQQWDDYKGVDVSGKILIMLNNDPATDDPNFFAGKGRTYYGRWTYKYEIAAKKGAVGAIVIHTTPSAGYPYAVIRNSWSREMFDLDDGAASALKIKVWTEQEATKNYLQQAGYSLDSLMAMAELRSFTPLTLDLKFSTQMRSVVRRMATNNIIGKIEGADPVLKNQYVIFSAHYDHFGIGLPINGDSIYNGALDNATGTSLMLTLAEAFASSPKKPSRSLLFAAVAAEEQGLLGSQFYATHPTVPAAQIAANINTDVMNMIGRTSDITFQGSDRSSLGNDIAIVANTMGLTLKQDMAPEQGGFFRSDHFSFAKVGIPAVSMGGGSEYVGVDTSVVRTLRSLHGKSYHQPSDEIQPLWSYDGGIQQAEFVIRLAWRLGNIIEMPYWNSGSEFNIPR